MPYQQAHSPLWKPGVVPLRPLSLTDIFNCALAYVRANPKPTLGLTTVVILTTAVIDFVISLYMSSTTGGTVKELTGAAAVGLASLPGNAALTCMLTVIVGRSVLGVPISAAEAWRRARRRVPALIGLKLLVLTANGTIVAVPVLVMMVLNYLVGWITATLIGMPLALIGFAGLTSLDIVLSFAPAAIVLERRNIPNAVRRSAGLVKGRFWRTLGIRLMAGIVGAAVAAAISVPLRIAFHVVLEFGAAAGAPAVGGAISEAIGQIIIVPFLAGVTTLLYFDARIRSEAFDFVLRTPRPLDADSVWL